MFINQHSIVKNQQFHTDIIKHKDSGVMFYKTKDGIILKKGNSEILIPYDNFQSFAMTALESYCSMDDSMNRHDWEIEVGISEIKKH